MLLGAAPVQLCSPEQRFYWRHTWRPVHSSVEKHLFPSFDTNNAPKNILALVPCAHSTRLFSLLLYPSLIQTEQTVLSLCFRNSWFIEVGVYLGDSTLVYLRAFNLESGIFFFYSFKVNWGLYLRLPTEVEISLWARKAPFGDAPNDWSHPLIDYPAVLRQAMPLWPISLDSGHGPLESGQTLWEEVPFQQSNHRE